MYIYELYNVLVNFFNGSTTLVKFMFTPVDWLGFDVPPIYFFGVGTLTAYIVIAVFKWALS